MPNLRLADPDIKALIDYLDTQKAAEKSASPAVNTGEVIAHRPGK
jgi:cytochrome c553